MVVFGPCFALCRAYNVSQYAAWIFGWVHWNHAGCLFGWLPLVAADVVEITSVHLNLNSDIISGLLNIECWILLNSTKFRDVFKLISICMHVCMHGLCYDFPISIELSVKAPTATITPRQWPPPIRIHVVESYSSSNVQPFTIQFNPIIRTTIPGSWLIQDKHLQKASLQSMMWYKGLLPQRNGGSYIAK